MEFITYKEASKICGIPVGTLYSYVSTGQIDCFYRLGKRLIRFKKEELLEWMESHKVIKIKKQK